MAKKKTEQEEQEVVAVEESTEAAFLLADLLGSKQFTPIEKDFMKSYLDEEKKYTVSEAKNALETKLKGAVKK